MIELFFIFFFGLWCSLVTGRYLRIKSILCFLIYSYHTLFSIIYYYYVEANGGDAFNYYHGSLGVLPALKFGTAFVYNLVSIFSVYIGLSNASIFLIFNIFGVIGLLGFYAALKVSINNKTRLLKFIAILIIFLPSVSFWSSAIGKDSISFMAVGLALWAALNFKRRMGVMAFAVVAMLSVRPHMAGMMVIALTVSTLMESRASLPKKTFMIILSASAAAVLVPFALTFAGLGDGVDLESVSSYIDTRQSYNMEGGGGIDIASMSLPEQMFTYMFRPLVFEVNSVFSAAAALDNLILLFLFIAGGWAMLKGKRSDLGENRVFMWVYALMAWGVLAMTTANLGIALRQKWMFAPMLIFLFISVMGRRKPLPSVAPHVGHAVHVSAVNASPRRRQL